MLIMFASGWVMHSGVAWTVLKKSCVETQSTNVANKRFLLGYIIIDYI